MQFQIIIPVFNRPNEVAELLDSLTQQTQNDFEVVVVDDGSEIRCEKVVETYQSLLKVHYFFKENSGPGQTRNFAAQYGDSDYLLILDSDCIVPPNYIENIKKELRNKPCDAFGGPDCAHDSFSKIQKAINYSMTSFFTTGGIRGGNRKLDKFYPRSFNFGIRRTIFNTLGGFSTMRFGEDIDLSIRIFEAGYSCRLFPQAWVYHKRRTELKKFFKQVYNSGIARINLYKRHPKSLKLVHSLPALFTIGLACILLSTFFLPWLLFLPIVFATVICIDATIQYKNLKIGIIAVAAAFIQLVGYGSGFLRAFWQRIVCKKPEFEAFKHNFYN